MLAKSTRLFNLLQRTQKYNQSTLTPLTALGPLDGRYERKVSALRDHFSGKLIYI